MKTTQLRCIDEGVQKYNTMVGNAVLSQASSTVDYTTNFIAV